MSRYIVFSHGRDSGPWGEKITAMAEVARREGYQADSVDYRGLDDPRARVARLIEHCQGLADPPVLVGSSLGGHVCTAASATVRARGLFLLAPAFYMPGFEQYTPSPAPCPLSIVHGWRDDIVAVDNSIRYAREHRAALHVLDSDHRLIDVIGHINHLLGEFLATLGPPA